MLLANDKVYGGNILYFSLQYRYVETTLYLLNWVKKYLGIEALKVLLMKCRVKEDEILETVLYRAVHLRGKESKEMIVFLIDFVKKI